MVLRDGGFDPIYSLTAQAIEYAADNGAKVINISSGFTTNYTVIATAVNYAVNIKDVVIIASAGNNGGTGDPYIRYPAKYYNTIAVGATDQNDNRRSYSAYGPEMDVVAPDGVPTTTIGGSYTSSVTGTSFSAPHVAGLAALIRSVHPSFTWHQVRNIMRHSADKVVGMGGQSFTNQYGYGRINVLKALSIPLISGFTQQPIPICKQIQGTVTVNLYQGAQPLNYDWSYSDKPSYISVVFNGNQAIITNNHYKSGLEKTEGIEAPQFALHCTATNWAGSSSSFAVSTFAPIISTACGCPTLAFDNGGILINENPLLITSMSNHGKDVTDYYLINTLLTPVDNRISLTIHEPQTEHTWLDEVKLIGARVKTNELVAVTDDGEIVNYRKPRIPLRMILNDSLDITGTLSELDGEKVSVKAGDYISVTINDSYLRGEAIEGDGDNMIMGGEEPGPPQKRIAGNVWFTNNTAGVKDNLNTELNSESTIKGDLGNFFFRPNLSIICKRQVTYLQVSFR